jgi:hypothetical protein
MFTTSYICKLLCQKKYRQFFDLPIFWSTVFRGGSVWASMSSLRVQDPKARKQIESMHLVSRCFFSSGATVSGSILFLYPFLWMGLNPPVQWQISSVPDPNPDPDPPDPHVFGPPRSGSTSQRYGIRIRILLSSSNTSKKNLDSYCFVTS